MKLFAGGFRYNYCLNFNLFICEVEIMCCRGFFRRIVPFVITFAVGLFIASFFVTIAAPNFRFKNRRWRMQQKMQQLESENQLLRERNQRLENQTNGYVIRNAFEYDVNVYNADVPPVREIEPNTIPRRVK